MANQYTIENVEDLRKKINRDYLIRLTFPKERKRIVVGFYQVLLKSSAIYTPSITAKKH